MKNKNTQVVVYTPMVADLFHYGHLKILEYAKSLGDYSICGIQTDEAVLSYRKPTITNFDERKAIVSALECVDDVMTQYDKDPTENLKQIHKNYENAKIVLIYGDNWKHIPGEDYIKKIGGEIVQPPYYKRLSTHKIVNDTIKYYKDKYQELWSFTDLFKINDIIQYHETNKKLSVISTKAETLRALRPLLKKSYIEKTFIFNVLNWNENKDGILKSIEKQFFPHIIIVRSSAINEDTLESSMAGYFLSQLNVDTTSQAEIENAIFNVINSYNTKGFDVLDNQILIQHQTIDIKMSGVIFTRKISTNTPYYLVNYDDHSGSTESVTAGIESRTTLIYKDSSEKIIPKKWKNLIISIKEIEDIIPDIPLDIEFAVKSNDDIVIFQVRPLVANTNLSIEIDKSVKTIISQMKTKFRDFCKPKSHLLGKTNIFSDMAFWNPSEIIGDNPNYLDYSLYSYLITDESWHKSLVPLGYKDVNPANLMMLFGNKPYIDLRNTFNSLFIEDIPKPIQEKMIDYFFKKLEKFPELHDKVEFEIHFTCYDFNFERRSEELFPDVLNSEELQILKNCLLKLTNDILKNHDQIITEDIKSINFMVTNRKKILARKKDNIKSLAFILKKLLDDCKNYGIEQFSRIARMAFIGKTLLKSLVTRKIVDSDFYHNFLLTIHTVASSLKEDMLKLGKNEISKSVFLGKYGHLRPGTYDITSKRYDKNENLFADISTLETKKIKFDSLEIDYNAITKVLNYEGVTSKSEILFDFIRKVIEMREFFKFEFTKNLSDAIEILAEIGNKVGFSRKDMAMIDIGSVLRLLDKSENEENIINVWKNLIEARKTEKLSYSNIALPSMIFSENDFEIVSYFTSKPNFITNDKIESEIKCLDSYKSTKLLNLKKKIVVIENADPGYDWIFTKDIAGLITKYGGVASHMAIRCAEFGIPAAIGCGQLIFEKVRNKKRIILDCYRKKIY